MVISPLLTTRHHLIDIVELFRGTLDGATVAPREVVKLVLARNAAAVILAHQHPSAVTDAYSTRAMGTAASAPSDCARMNAGTCDGAIPDRRLLIFLAVFICHVAIIFLLIRPARSPIPSLMEINEPLVLLLLPPKAREPIAATFPRPTNQPPSTASTIRPTKPANNADNSISVAPAAQPPRIDWEEEAEQAAKNAIATRH